MKLLPALAYNICLNLPATFSQPCTSIISEPSSKGGKLYFMAKFRHGGVGKKSQNYTDITYEWPLAEHDGLSLHIIVMHAACNWVYWLMHHLLPCTYCSFYSYSFGTDYHRDDLALDSGGTNCSPIPFWPTPTTSRAPDSGDRGEAREKLEEGHRGIVDKPGQSPTTWRGNNNNL